MKATLILKGSSSSIIYFSADKEFLDHTKEKAVEEKLLEGDVFQIEQIVVLIYGLPTIFINMKSSHSQIKGLATADGLNIQVVEMAGFYFIAFDTGRNLEFLERKLHILNSIITWFIGPTLKFSPSSGDGRGYCNLCPEYNPAYPNAQRDAWFLVNCLLEVWEYLFFTDQCFMLEAYEKHVVNFNVMTKYKDILEVVTQSHKIGQVYPNCSIILVKNKILEFKEMRDATKDILHTSDLLLVLLLTNYLHPSRKLLQAMRKIDAMNGCHFDDSFFDVCRPSPFGYETDGTFTETETEEGSADVKDSFNQEEDNRAKSEYFDASEEISPDIPPSPRPGVRKFSDDNNNNTQNEVEVSDEVGAPIPPEEMQEPEYILDGLNLNSRRGTSTSIRGTANEGGESDTETPSWDPDDVICNPVRRVTLLESKDFEMSGDASDGEENARGDESRGKKYSQDMPSGYSRKKRRNLKYRPLCPILVANSKKDNHATLVNCLSKGGDSRLPTDLFFMRIPVKDVVLMFSTSRPNKFLARTISKMVAALDIILFRGIVLGINPHDLTEMAMQQMHEEICGVFKEGTYELNELEKLWGDCVRFGLGEYLNESHAQFGSVMMAPQTGKLESALENYQRCLKSWYERIFLGATFGASHVTPEDFEKFCQQITDSFISRVNLLMPRAEQGTKELLQFMQGRVAGFKVTLNTFPQIYPGLIHFVHINRATNQITAPKLSAYKNGSLMSVFWKFVAKCRQIIVRKVSYIVWKDQLYTFTYSLSFENRQFFDRLAGDRGLTEEQLENILEAKPVGFLSYNTYQQMKYSLFSARKPGFDSIVATETYCIQVPEMPASFALRQNRKISEHVWDACYRKGIPLA